MTFSSAVRVAVTGGAGRIGHCVAVDLAGRGYDVITLDAVDSPVERLAHSVVDVCDLAAVRSAILGVDVVVHCAAVPRDDPSLSEEIFRTNVAGTCNVLLAAAEAGIARVVQLSSINALGCVGVGRPRYLPVDDDYPAHPSSPYQVSKFLGEQAARVFAAQHGLCVVVLRPTWVIFPSPAVAEPLGPGPSDLWAYVDVRDLTEAVHLALSVPMNGWHAMLVAAADRFDAGVGTSELRTHFGDVPWLSSRHGERPLSEGGSLVVSRVAEQLLGWAPRLSRYGTNEG